MAHIMEILVELVLLILEKVVGDPKQVQVVTQVEVV